MKKLLLTIATVLWSHGLFAQDPTPIDPLLSDPISKDLIVSQLQQGKDPATFDLSEFEITLIESNVGKNAEGTLVLHNTYKVVNTPTKKVFVVVIAMGINAPKPI